MILMDRVVDARRFLEDLKERLAKFGLEIHPEMIRLIEFGRYAARDRQQGGGGNPEKPRNCEHKWHRNSPAG